MYVDIYVCVCVCIYVYAIYLCLFSLQGANILLTERGDVKLGQWSELYIWTHKHTTVHRRCDARSMSDSSSVRCDCVGHGRHASAPVWPPVFVFVSCVQLILEWQQSSAPLLPSASLLLEPPTGKTMTLHSGVFMNWWHLIMCVFKSSGI